MTTAEVLEPPRRPPAEPCWVRVSPASAGEASRASGWRSGAPATHTVEEPADTSCPLPCAPSPPGEPGPVGQGWQRATPFRVPDLRLPPGAMPSRAHTGGSCGDPPREIQLRRLRCLSCPRPLRSRRSLSGEGPQPQHPRTSHQRPKACSGVGSQVAWSVPGGPPAREN